MYLPVPVNLCYIAEILWICASAEPLQAGSVVMGWPVDLVGWAGWS